MNKTQYLLKHRYLPWALAATCLLMFLRCWVNYRGLNSDYDTLQADYDQLEASQKELSGRYKTLLDDFESKKVVPHAQIAALLEAEFALVEEHFPDYRSNLSTLLEQARWYEENVSPYLNRYSGYVSKAVKFIRQLPLPLPYLNQIASALETSLKYSSELKAMASLISTFSARIDLIDAAYQEYLKSPERSQAVKLGRLLGQDYAEEARLLDSMLGTLDTLFSVSSDAVGAIKGYKDSLTSSAGGLISGLAQLGSSSVVGNLFEQADDIDLLLSNMELRTADFEGSAKSLRNSLNSDIRALSRIEMATAMLR